MVKIATDKNFFTSYKFLIRCPRSINSELASWFGVASVESTVDGLVIGALYSTDDKGVPNPTIYDRLWDTRLLEVVVRAAHPHDVGDARSHRAFKFTFEVGECQDLPLTLDMVEGGALREHIIFKFARLTDRCVCIWENEMALAEAVNDENE